MAVYTDHDLYFVADWSTNAADFDPSTDRGRKLIDIKTRLLASGLAEEDIKFGSSIADLNNGANVFVMGWKNDGDKRIVVIGGEEVQSSKEVTCHFFDVTRNGASRWDLRGDYYDIYLDGCGGQDRWFYAMPNQDSAPFQKMDIRGGTHAYTSVYGALDVTIKNSTFSFNNQADTGIFILGRGTQDYKLYSDLNVTIENTVAGHINLGNGSVNWNNSWYKGWIFGNITFTIKNTQINVNNESSWVTKGGVGRASDPKTITGTIENSNFAHDFRGVMPTAIDTQNNKDWSVYASFDLTLKGATNSGNFSLGTVETDTTIWEGDNVMHVSGSTAAGFNGWRSNRPVTREGQSNSFTIEFDAFESDNPQLKKSIANNGNVDNLNHVKVNAGAIVEVSGNIAVVDNGTITIDATSSVTAAAITTGANGTITIGVGAKVNTGSITTPVIQVTGELTEAETILISGLTSDELGDTKVMVGDREFTKGIFGGQYSITAKGDLVLHDGETYLVNREYTDGQATALGPTGYTTIANAQAAIADPTKTTITVYGLDDETPEIAPGNELNEDLNTKNFTIAFVTDDEDDNAIEFNNHSILIGDSETVDSTNLSVAYTNNINAITFGNITNKATVSVADSDIAELNLLNATVGEAELSFSNDVITTVKLADKDGFKGNLTIANSTIENVYVAKSGLDVDMGGGNTIANVYAEGNASEIKLGTSEVGKFVAGYTDAKSVTTFDYEGAVNANELFIGGEENKNTIGTLNAKITGGSVYTIRLGGSNDTINGDANITFDGGEFDNVAFGEIAGKANITLSGGHFTNGFEVYNVAGKTTVTLAGGTVAMPTGSTAFIGLVYGASVSGVLDGGNTGSDLIVDGNAKVESVQNFTSLNVLGGTLNVAGGNTKSEVRDGNTLEIDGDITNRRGINAGAIIAKNLTNYGLIGVLREEADDPGITLSGNLVNESYIKTANLTVEGSFKNTGKITSVGDITVTGSFSNSGEIYFRSTFSQDGEFSQEGGLFLNDIDVTNSGFISAASLTGVRNLTTSKMYITGGAEISGNLTITAGAEVAFTNKAEEGLENGLSLGGSITMYDTSALIVSGDLDTNGTKTITINCGDLIGVNELVRAEGGVDEWTIKLAGAGADSKYEYVQDEVSILIYSTDEVFVCSEFDEDADNYFDGHKLLYGKNAFATVAEAVAGAKAGAKIHLYGDFKNTDVAAAAFDVILDGVTNVDGLTAKTVTVTADSDIKSIIATDKLTINADAQLTVTETLPTNLPITIDGSEGTGSRLVLDVDSKYVTLTEDQVTVISAAGKSYGKRILAGEGAHAGDLYIISQDNVFYRKDLTGATPAVFVDGESFDGATGDALFNDVNIFGERAQAEAIATTNKGTVYLVGFYGSDADGRNDETVPTAYEFASNGDSIYGSEGSAYGTPEAANAADHATIISGTTTAATIYGLNKYVNMTGDYTFIAENTVQTGGDLWIMGNTHSNVMNGNVTAEITGSTFRRVYLGTGNFGTDEKKPIDIDITIRDSRLSGFYGIHTQRDNNDPANRQDINANFTVRIYDSYIDGGTVTFLNTNNENYSGENVTQLQTYYTAGSITLELGGVYMPEGNIRIGSSLEVCGKATQAFNVPITVHVVATENSTVTHCDWVCDVDTLIVDATAQLLIDNALQYTTVDKDAGNAIDNGGTLTQVMINMSGYKSGTHNVIQANYSPSWGGDTNGIYTDNALSNITVIGDNDLTGQCELAYLTRTSDGNTFLNAVYVFDKSDDMFVNPNYTDAINGTADKVTGQEFLLNYNAHTDFDKAFRYANEWGGSITVTGGEWGDVDFQGNDVAIRKGASFDSVTMADGFAAWDEATLTVEDGAFIGVIDGSKSIVDSTLLIEKDVDLETVKDFSTVLVIDATATFESLSGSDISITAASMIIADELDMTGSTLTVDVTGYVGRPHVIVSAIDELTGFDASKVEITGENKDKFSVIQVDNNIVLKTTIPSDTFLNSTYSEATTGTILDDGTYLEYGFNAFSDGASALAGLGSRTNTLTITGGDIAGDLVMNGANFVLAEGSLEGVVYATYEKDYRNMSITVGNGSVGGIEMTAQEGSYRVTRGTITLEDGAIVTGSISGANDTALTISGDVSVAQGIEGVKTLVIDANSTLATSSINLAEGGSIRITSGVGEAKEGNYFKVISTTGGYTDSIVADGVHVIKQGNDIYVLDLSRIYYDPNYTAADTKHANGDTLVYGTNAFSSMSAAISAVEKVTGGTLYVNGYRGDGTIQPSKHINAVITNTRANNIILGSSGGNPAYNGDLYVYMSGATWGQDESYILGRGTNGSRDVINGSITIEIENSLIRSSNGGVKWGPEVYALVNGNTNSINVVIRGSTINNDVRFWGTSPLGGDYAQTYTLTLENCRSEQKWWCLTWNNNGVNPSNTGDFIVNIKDSCLGQTGGTDMRFGLSDGNWNQNGQGTVVFNLEGATVYGNICAKQWDNNNVAAYTGASEVNILGGSNYVYRLGWFDVVNMKADAYLTTYRFTLDNAADDPGLVNIDATGYTGGTKGLIRVDGDQGFANVKEFTLEQDGDTYALIQADTGSNHSALILYAGSLDNIYWNPSYTKAVTGTMSQQGDMLVLSDTIITEGYQDLANAFQDLETAKKALKAGDKLYVTGTGTDFNGELYGTLDTEEITEGDINMVVADGDFTKTRTDAWGETVGSIIAAANIWDPEYEHIFTGNSTIEIAGGTYGKAAVVDADGNTTSEAVFADIVGTREVAGGTSGLLVTFSSNNLYANLSDFDYMSVQGTIRVRGNISLVDALTIDCNGSLTVDGTLDADSIGSIVLSSKDYEGPSKIVLHSDNLTEDIINAIDIVVDDGHDPDTEDPYDGWFFDANSKNLWLVSGDPSNVFLNDTYTAANVTGKTFEQTGDLMYFGINAVDNMEDAIAKTTSEYKLFVTGGTFAGDYSLAGIGGSSVYVDGGTIGSLTVGNTEGASLTRIELTGATAKSAIGTITGDEAGFRLILDKDAKVTTANNVQYIRIGLDQSTGIYEANYIAEGGRFVLDLSKFNARSGNVLSIAGGLNNFLIPVEGETYTLAHVEATNDATHDYGFYYDAESKNIVSVAMGADAYIRPDANSSMTGTIVDGTKLVYGFNVTTDGTAASYAKGGTVYITDTLTGTAVMADNDVNAVIKNSALGSTQFGVTGTTANAHVRQGDFTLEVEGGTFNAATAFAGRGEGSSARTTLIVGTQATEGAEIVDGVYNLTFKALKDEAGEIVARSRHNDNGFRIAQYANIAGGTVNVLFEDYYFRGDLKLFESVWNVGEDKQELDEVNVTITGSTCPQDKWLWIWDPREANSTTVNLTITDSVFSGGTMGVGLFGDHTTDWNGKATVTISGVTVTGGDGHTAILSGGRGIGSSGSGQGNGVNGERTLKVVGDSNIDYLMQFTTIDIADGVKLTGYTISLPTGTYSTAGFILRGETGYTGDVKEYAVFGSTITGGDNVDISGNAEFLDAEGNAIAGYTAVVGSTNVFIYKQDGAIYYNKGYTAATTGTAVESDAVTGKKNFLVFNDNAVADMTEAYSSADLRDNKLIVVEGANDSALYANGYKLVVNGGYIGTLYGSAITPVTPEGEDPVPTPDVEFADITLSNGANVPNVIVATETSNVTGNALVTVVDGAAAGTLNGAEEFVGGTSKLVFEGNATAFSITAFDDVTIQATSEVVLTSTFTGKSLTIDVTGFTGASKRVMTVNGEVVNPEDLVINSGSYSTQWVNEGKNLVLVSDVVTDVYVNTAWTEADVTGKFVGDMLLVWNKNAFNTIAGGAQAVGADSTLYVSGDFQSADALALSNASVVLQGATVGLGAVTATGTALTVQSTQFTAASLSGISELSVKADAVAISGAIAMTGDGKLTIDVTGHSQDENDVVVLTTDGGITGLAKDITVTGNDANHYYAYYDEKDGDIHMLRIDNMYVDLGFGTAGEGIPEGAVHPVTSEPLVFGANAFYAIDDAVAKLADGMGLYVNGYTGSVNTNNVSTDLYLTNSDIPVLINGFTNGDIEYTGDINITIMDSTISAGGNSTIVAKTMVGDPWNHLTTVTGNVMVDISGSTFGSETAARTVNGSDYLRVTNGNFTFNVSDSLIYANLEVLGDSPIANDEVVTANFTNVSAPVSGRNIWITDGNQNNAGTIVVNLSRVNFGDMQIATQSDWNYGDRNSSNKVTFNVSDATIGGSISADCIGREELTGYSGAKVLNITGGSNAIGQVLWFKEINIDATATLDANVINMSTASAKVVVDGTKFSGKSRVIVSAAEGIANITGDDVTGKFAAESTYEVVTDYNEIAKTMTTIAIKGDLKDIYANEDYTLDDLTIGTTYNGEALFCNFNAFDTVEAALEALTVEGASLYVTGNLAYEGPEGQVLTISNDLINDGTFKLSSKGFVDGTNSDVMILTATSITGTGKFTTDNAAYTTEVRDNAVYLVLKKVDVFVNTAWAELEDGSVVEIPGGTAILGTDAFATADLAASKVSANGTITVLASDVTFSSSIVRTVTATAGSTIQNANIGSSSGTGSLTLLSGSTATNAQVRTGSTLTVDAGSAVLGGLMISDGAIVSFGENTVLDLNISSMSTSDDAVMTGYSIMTGSPAISITIAADQADGTYAIATDAASFGAQAVTLKTVAATIADDLTLGTTKLVEGIEYTLGLTNDNVLTLTKKVFEEPIAVTYVDPAWANLADGTVVPVTAGTAIVGKDAFADADLATEKVISTGIVKVVGGTVTFANGITKQTEILSGAELTNTNVSSVLTVDAGATLSGKAAFVEGANVTINGTVVFDLALADEAQFTGFSVAGDATYTLVGNSVVGDYTLATGVTAFTNLTVGAQTLAAGESIIVDDAFTYSLSLTEGTLALNIAEYVPPVVIPGITYVNSAWITKQDGDKFTLDDGTQVTYKYDAFATGDEAIAAVADDGTVQVLGGTVSFTDAIAKTVTISADATLFGKATFGTAITIDGTVAFDIANATSTEAQFAGFSKVTGDTKYTLTAKTAAVGTYLLASDAAGFNSDVTFGNETLKVGAEAITIGDFTYQLGITGNNDLALTIAAKPEPPTPSDYIAKSDINGNGISDVMFQYTGGDYQLGYWLDGTNNWQGTGIAKPAEWDVLGAYDMTGNGKADSVLFGNVTSEAGVKGAYIGYYADANDADANWVTIGYLTNEDDIDWKNKVGNLTGNEQGTNSIVWYTYELGSLGAWTDGTKDWVSLAGGFDANWKLIGCGDFNGDGKDQVVMSYNNGESYFAYGIGIDAYQLASSDSGWEVRAIGDFSGDGKDDIVVFHAETGLVAMWGDGNSANWSKLGQLDAEDWFVVGAGDYNKDQKDDLLVRQYSTGMLGYYVSGDMDQWVELGRGVDMNWTVIA